MGLAILSVIAGLAVLVWSADRFLDGAVATASYAGMPPLVIGMVIVGFGTSAPELVVSALAAAEGRAAMALGNAYGSNIANIGLILGVTALLSPIRVQSRIVRRELPVLAGVTLIALGLIGDGQLSRLDAGILLTTFAVIMGWTLAQSAQAGPDAMAEEARTEFTPSMPLKRALFWLITGFALLLFSARILVAGAVAIAQTFGVSDTVIGLTILAVGTSLPELAASFMAALRGEHDLALGNVLGSNLFNTLAVVGLAAAIEPFPVDDSVLTRDWVTMMTLTFALIVMAVGRRGPGPINRWEGAALVGAYLGYTGWLVFGVML